MFHYIIILFTINKFWFTPFQKCSKFFLEITLSFMSFTATEANKIEARSIFFAKGIFLLGVRISDIFNL